MKKLVFTLVFCLTALSFTQAQVYKTIANAAGSLGPNLGTEISTVTDLTVTGQMDARDFKVIRDNMPALVNLDISNVAIILFNGTGGTSLTLSATYQANQIPTRAFYNKTNFGTVLLPTTGTTLTLGAQSFYGFSSVNPLNIPRQLTNVTWNLNYCKASFTVDPNNTALSAVDGVLYNKSQTTITQVPTSKTGDFVIPSSVTTIGIGAFIGCNLLTTITIPQTVITLSGTTVFNYCSAQINVDAANTNFSSVDGVLFNKAQTTILQVPNSKTGEYSIPSTVTKIESSSFAGCSGLTSITIPRYATSITTNAFAGCTGLITINILTPTPPTLTGNPFASNNATCILKVPAGSLSSYQGASFWGLFTTIQESGASLDTNAATNVLVTSATLNAAITNLVEAATAHGFCWNTTGTPIITDSKIDKGAASTTGAFTYDVTLLQANTMYYVRAYTTINGVTTYSNEVNFTTLNTYQLTTNAASSILAKSATLIGDISYSEATDISNYGFCWNTTGTPTIANSKEDLGVNPAAGAFSKNITGLNGSTTYYYRTFATSGGVTTYGLQRAFTTALPDDYDITVQINGSGTVNTGGTPVSNGSLVNVLRGATKTFTFSPNDGYQLTAVTYNGTDVFSQITNNQFTTAAVNAYGTLAITFGNNIRTINVPTAGTLTTLLSAIDKSIITNLTVTGNIDARDVKCMRDEMPLLVNLYFSLATMKAYSGIGGTSVSVDGVYPANEVPENAFSNKVGLKVIQLPNSLMSIGGSAFQYCSNLKILLSFNPTPPTVASMSFDGVTLNAVYVPMGKVATYKATTSWSGFNIVEPGINTSTPTINSLIYAPNAGPSDIQPFNLSGGLLTSDITVTAPANYELSTKSGAAFTPTNVITVSPVDGMVAETTFYVRLKAGLSVNAYTGNITIEATGFTTQNIALNGIVRTTPEVINVATAGTLSSLLSAIEKAAITKLTVTGNIDAQDILCIREEMTKISILDLNSTTVIEYSGFNGTSPGMSNTYPANEMPQNSFYNYSSGKTSLITIKLPNSITSIGDYAFRGCTGLTGTLFIPNSVTTIKSSAFYGCYNIKTLYLGNSVSSIGDMAFAPMNPSTKLKTIISLNPTPPTLGTNPSPFSGQNPTIIYVPIGKVSTYKAALDWSGFNIVEPGISTTTPTVTGFIYAPNGGPSEIKPFIVSSGLLTSDITVTAPTNFELSTKSGTAFTPTNVITVSPIDGMVADTTFYVRLKAGLSLNSYSGNITLEATGFTTQNIALNGIVRTIPEVINVVTAGTLSSLLTATEKAVISNFKITGTIDARDIKYVRDEMPLLVRLDLSGANIVAYSGYAGTGYSGMSITYPANEMPEYSFWKYLDYSYTSPIKTIKLPNNISSLGGSAFRRCTNLKAIICLNTTPPTVGSMSFDGTTPTVVYVPAGSVTTYKASSAWVSFNVVAYKLKATTQTVNSIKLSSAKISGSIDVITESPVSAHGFCWNTTGTPTIADSKVNNGATTTEGTYSNTIENLTGATPYYVRAFATDGTSGTVYGDEVSFTTAEIPATSNLSGNYFNSQYWTKSKSPYTITGNVNLAIGTTLTIEPGVVVNFAGNYEIVTMGNVIANGTAIDSITFNANNNLCTFVKLKNTKLSDSEFSYLKLEGSLQSNYYGTGPGYSYAFKTEGTLTDSIMIYNTRLNKSKINSSKKVIIKNSTLLELLAESTKTEIVNSSIRNSDFGGYPGNTDLVIKHSNIDKLIISGGSYNSNFYIYNSTVKSSNFGSINGNLRKSNLYNCSFGYSPGMLLDSTILVNPTSYSSWGNCTISNCIFTTDSTQNISIGGTITKSQFIGNNNKLGGVGLDAVTGTITNSIIVNHRIGLQTSGLTINNSNLINNSQYTIKNTSATTIDAKNNYWGVGNTTSASIKKAIYDYNIDMSLGKVLYDNYLTTPNTDCPITPPQNVQKTTVSGGVSYTWNANPESDVKGYKLNYGAFDGFTFANSVDVGNVTTYTLSNTSLTDIVLVTAYDQQADGKEDRIEGHESWYSAYTYPEKAGVITGSTSVCQGETSKVYTVPVIANASSYSWTLPNGAIGTSTTNSISVDFSANATSGNITVKGQNDFGEGAISSLPITINVVPTTTSGLGTLMGMSTVNQGQNSVTYYAYYNNATSYKWTLPDGATGTSTTNNITVNYSTSAISGNLTVTPHNDCGDGVTTSLPITVRPLPGAAGTITGKTIVCYGQSAVIYSVQPINNATSYQWTLPSGTSGYSTTNTISVNYNTATVSGDISVCGKNTVGSGAASTLAVSITLPVGASGAEAVAGPKTVCLGQKAVTYTTPLVDNATSYVWTLPTGVTGTSSTNSITVDFGSTAVSGSISVKGKNDCGEGWSSFVFLTVVQPIGNAGTISGASTVCQGQSNVTYTVPAIDNAVSYEWTLPTGATGTSTTNTISLNYAKTAVSGDITVKGKNSCGTGASSTLSVTVNPLPVAAGTITGKTSVCQGESSVTYTVPVIDIATSYKWTLPSGASGSSTTNTIVVDYSNSAISGSISVKGHNDCGDGIVSTLPITINQLPVISVSDKTVVCGGSVSLNATTNYSGGGTLEYLWTPSTGLNDAAIANPTATLIADKTFTLTVKTPSGCTTSSNVTVRIIPMSKPAICMVGVHSSNKNIIVWEKPVSIGIDSYNIYRESNVTNVYDKIGSVLYNSTSTFIDNLSSPDVQSNSYKLTVVDKVGFESEQSNLHKTMHLSINKGLNTTWNLNWEKYEGFTVSTYNVYRGTTVNNLALIGSTSGNNSQFSDVNAPTGDVYYQLEVVNPTPCVVSAPSNAAQKVKTLYNSVYESYSSSRSNIATNVQSGIEDIYANCFFKVYPNPVKNELRIEYDGIANYEVINTMGQVLYNGNLIQKSIIETSNLKPGIYVIKLSTGKTFEYKKIVKE